MKLPVKKTFTRIIGKFLLSGLVLPALFTSVSVFGDDQRVLDDLYNQIMSASTQELGAMDSGASKSMPVDHMMVSPAADPNSEKLRQEIEKVIEEAKQHHSDAIKFMREDR